MIHMTNAGNRDRMDLRKTEHVHGIMQLHKTGGYYYYYYPNQYEQLTHYIFQDSLQLSPLTISEFSNQK